MAGGDFGSIPGNEELKRWLAREIRGGTLGHAYIIEGGGIIHSLADDIAKAVLCTGSAALPCGACASCRKIAAGSHPDVRVISRGERATLGVDTVRLVRADTFVIPSESERKVYIIEDADTMTAEAQNALLLSLEEPPEYVLYLLLCQDSKSLLETIRSRAPALRCRQCTRGEIEEYLLFTVGARAKTMRDREREKWDELLVIAGGDPAAARGMIEDGTLDELIASKHRALELITQLLSGDDDAIIDIATMKKVKRAATLELISDMASALRDMLLSKKTRSFDTCFFTTADAAADAGTGFSAKKIAAAIDHVRECGAQIDKNAAIGTALYSMAIKIRNA